MCVSEKSKSSHLCGDGNALKLNCSINCTILNSLVYIKCMNFMICKLYLNKAVFFLKDYIQKLKLKKKALKE